MSPPRTRVIAGYVETWQGFDLARLRVPFLQAAAPEDGPCVWLTAGAHGDEASSVVVIHETFRRVRQRGLRRGALRAFPVMNPAGFAMNTRRIPFSDEDLNRIFPGAADGSFGQRCAHGIYHEIRRSRPDLVVDLHTDWRRSIPYVVLDAALASGPRATRAAARARRAALGCGLPVVQEGAGEAIHGALSGSLLRDGIPAMTVELGESGMVNELEVQRGLEMVWRILASEDMVDAPEPSVATAPPGAGRDVLRYCEEPRSPRTGVARHLREPGAFVRVGDPVARVSNATGRTIALVRATRAGLVLGHQECSVVYRGQALLALGAPA